MLEACIPCDNIKEIKEAASDSPYSSEDECDCDKCLSFNNQLLLPKITPQNYIKSAIRHAEVNSFASGDGLV